MRIIYYRYQYQSVLTIFAEYLDLYFSKLFWITGEKGSREIVSGTFDGKVRETVVDTVNLTNPSGLYYNPTNHR